MFCNGANDAIQIQKFMQHLPMFEIQREERRKEEYAVHSRPRNDDVFIAIRTRVQQRSDNVGTSVFDRRANILANALHLCSNTACSSHDDQSSASPHIIGTSYRCQLSEIAPIASSMTHSITARRTSMRFGAYSDDTLHVCAACNECRPMLPPV